MSRVRHGLARAVLMVAAALSGACSLVPAPSAPMSQYLLSVPRAGAAPHGGEMVLAVDPPRADPGFTGRGMVYVSKAHRLGYYSRHQWVEPPARMLAPLLAQALQAGGAFRAVVLEPSAVQTDLRLETRIVRLQQEFLSHPSRVRFTLEARLVGPAGRRVLATRSFDVEQAAPGDDPYSGVLAANRAVDEVLGEVVKFCSAQAARLAHD